jgi:hypothetical protein
MLTDSKLSNNPSSVGKTFGRKNLPEDSPVQIVIRKYSDDAGCFGDNFTSGTSLCQLQLQHNAMPSVLFQLKAMLDAYFQHRHSTDPNEPETLAEMEHLLGMKLIINNNKDPDGVGYVPWRIALYVSGGITEVKNVLMMLDGFIYWRAEKETARPFPNALTQEVCNTTSLELSLSEESDELECSCAVKKVLDTLAADTFMTAVHHAQPPTFKRRMIRADIEVKSPTTMAVVFSGDTWPHRTHFDGGAIAGQFVKSDGTAAERGEKDADYYRVIPEYTFVGEDSIASALQYFTTMIANTAIVVCWDVNVEGDTFLSQFLRQLSEQPNVTVIPT